MKIQPGLTDSDNIPIGCGMGDEHISRQVRKVLGMMRMHTDRAPDVGMRASYRTNGIEIVEPVADGEKMRHAHGAGAVEHIAQIIGIGLAMQVHMRIKHGSPSALQRVLRLSASGPY